MNMKARFVLALTTAAVASQPTDSHAQTYTNPHSVISDLMCPTSQRPDTPDGLAGDPKNNIQILVVGTQYSADCWKGSSWATGVTYGRGWAYLPPAAGGSQLQLQAYLFGNIGDPPRRARVWGYNAFGLINGCVADDNTPDHGWGTLQTYTNGANPVGCAAVQNARVMVYNHL
jgi:hypothetical protein